MTARRNLPPLPRSNGLEGAKAPFLFGRRIVPCSICGRPRRISRRKDRRKNPAKGMGRVFQCCAVHEGGRRYYAVEDVSSRASQWWTNGGLYLGQEVVDSANKSHALRSPWDLTGKIVHYRQDRHVLTIGPNGSGKTRRVFFPQLYRLKDWSIAAIDPKGELFAIPPCTGGGGESNILLDPFAVVKTNYPHLANASPVKAPASIRGRARSGQPALCRSSEVPRVALIQTEAEREKYWSQAAQAW